MITAVTVILIITIIIVSLLFGYYFGKSVGITMAINYIEDKYTNKNKHVSNIFKGILNNYNKIKKKKKPPSRSYY
jgi:LytS/YehU family sensor histidine kinase